MKKKESFSQEVLYPVSCQDLDRARLAAGRKKDATDAFKKGLRYGMGNGELQEELGAWSEKKASCAVPGPATSDQQDRRQDASSEREQAAVRNRHRTGSAEEERSGGADGGTKGRPQTRLNGCGLHTGESS